MRKLPSSKIKGGFTLTETLIASSLLTLTLVCMYASIINSFVFIDSARELRAASYAAQSKIESLRSASFDSLLAMGASSTFSSSSFSILNNPTGTLAIENIYSNNNIRRVSVTVTWTSGASTVKHRTIVTLISRNGIDRQ